MELKIWINSPETANRFVEYLTTKLNANVHHEDGRSWTKIVCKSADLNQFIEELEFLNKVNNLSYYNVDFVKQTFEDYDED